MLTVFHGFHLLNYLTFVALTAICVHVGANYGLQGLVFAAPLLLTISLGWFAWVIIIVNMKITENP